MACNNNIVPPEIRIRQYRGTIFKNKTHCFREIRKRYENCRHIVPLVLNVGRCKEASYASLENARQATNCAPMTEVLCIPFKL